jgi:hypothetical protein
VEQPADEGARVEVDKFLLPRHQLDLPLMLLAWAVLRE